MMQSPGSQPSLAPTSGTLERMRLLVIAKADKPEIQPALRELAPWLSQRVELLGINPESEAEEIRADADAILVLGGDGTLLSVARRLRGRRIPVMGVNFGRLGFLASFTPEQFRNHFEAFLQRKLPIRARQMIQASVIPRDIPCQYADCADVDDKQRFSATALNDAVVTAGPPFRMIDLEISADSDSGVHYSGDGVIISTASGSTAYNVSAGGPIISPDVEAMCITPLCPHSLSFRPVVISLASRVLITARKVNAGTTLFCDGQASTPLGQGERIVIRRSEHEVLLVENPDARQWRTLAEKLHWAVGPRYNDGPKSTQTSLSKPTL